MSLMVQDGQLHVSQRLLAGACAGMSATLVTHPLDVVRLRLSLPHAGYTGKLPLLCSCLHAERRSAIG